MLLEVNVSGETVKHGFSPDELLENWSDVVAQSRLQIVGLMTMAPRVENAEEARGVFRRLRELRDRLVQTSTTGGLTLPHLSMGMSGDFEVAIEEGATIVRIGSRLFEGLR